jgi:hypothetical protein
MRVDKILPGPRGVLGHFTSKEKGHFLVISKAGLQYVKVR